MIWLFTLYNIDFFFSFFLKAFEWTKTRINMPNDSFKLTYWKITLINNKFLFVYVIFNILVVLENPYIVDTFVIYPLSHKI